jgi:hypothetical protein
VPITRVFCTDCAFSLPEGLDGDNYALSEKGERVSTGMHPSAAKVQEITGMDYWTANGAGRAGYLSHCVCLDCLESQDLDLERDKKRCARCDSERVFSRRGLPSEDCPRCRSGRLRYEITAVT